MVGLLDSQVQVGINTTTWPSVVLPLKSASPSAKEEYVPCQVGLPDVKASLIMYQQK